MASRLRGFWRLLVGFVRRRAHAARAVERAGAIADATAAKLAAVEDDLRRSRLELSSAVETIEARDREIVQLNVEKAQRDATIAVRVQEVAALQQLLERMRVQLNADIAVQVAREQTAMHPSARAGGSGQSSDATF